MIQLLSILTLQFLSPGYGPGAKKSLNACICLTVNASQPRHMFPNNETNICKSSWIFVLSTEKTRFPFGVKKTISLCETLASLSTVLAAI